MGTATSIDGSTFSFHAAVDGLELQPGSYASVGEHLGQVHTVELLAEERGSVRGEGMLLEGGVAPFHDMTIGRADEARVAAWLEGTRPKRAGLDVGELTTEHGVRFLLDAGGFDRHTFFCGQSGSGKSYALGTVLEQLLLETSLRIVVLDPNSDFVRIGALRDGVDGDVADRYRERRRGRRRPSRRLGGLRTAPRALHRLRGGGAGCRLAARPDPGPGGVRRPRGPRRAGPRGRRRVRR